MISPGMCSCEHTLNTLRYADRVKELGCDEGGGATPLDDEDLMLAKTDSDDDLRVVSSRLYSVQRAWIVSRSMQCRL